MSAVRLRYVASGLQKMPTTYTAFGGERGLYSECSPQTLMMHNIDA